MSLRIHVEQVGAREHLEAFAPAEHREERAVLHTWLLGSDPRRAPQAFANARWLRLHGALHAHADEIDFNRLAEDRPDLIARLRADELDPLGVALELFYGEVLGAVKLETERREAERFTRVRRSRAAWNRWERVKLGGDTIRGAIETLLTAIDARGDAAHERDARRRRLLAAPLAMLQEMPPRRRRREGVRQVDEAPNRVAFEVDLLGRPLRWVARLVDLMPGGDLDPPSGRLPSDPVCDGRRHLMAFLVKALGLDTASASEVTSALLSLFVRAPARAPRRGGAWPPPASTIRRDWARST